MLGQLSGKRIVITAGPTIEPLDPVRYLSNHSSGKQGYAIAAAAIELGAETILISGPTQLPIPPGVQLFPVKTAQEMLQLCLEELPFDVGIFTAAVCDWRAAKIAEQKIKKTEADYIHLKLKKNPDILATIAAHKSHRPRFLVGFSAETEDLIINAQRKRKAKACDLMIANDVGAEPSVFGNDYNKVYLIDNSGIESWPSLTKIQIAKRLMDHIAGVLLQK